MVKKENHPLAFKLNITILADALEDHLFPNEVHPGRNFSCLGGVRYFGVSPSLQPDYVYLIKAGDLPDAWSLSYLNLIILGDFDDERLPGAFSYITFSDSVNGDALFSLVQDIFEKYSAWDRNLQHALTSDTPFEEMAAVSLPILKNPIFIHDSDFFILACPWRPEGMAGFDRDERTGREIVRLDTLNVFKIDSEYTYSLTTHGPTMFYSSPNGYRILYINLWSGTHYEGRICVNEIRRPIMDSDYQCLSYLAEVVCQHIAKYNMIWSSFVDDIDPFLKAAVSGRALDFQETRLKLGYLRWSADDTYLCIRLKAMEYEGGDLSPIGAINYVEAQLPGSHAFPFDHGITVLVNLTLNKASIDAISSKLATIMREGLYKVGLSNAVTGFSQINWAYKQAAVALRLGIERNSMIWRHAFSEYALDYFLETACSELPPERLCVSELLILRDHDAAHSANLYETLRVYLENERNVTHTAKALYIHRSTLLYRLDRIEDLTRLTLDDPQTRLALELSYLMLKEETL